MIQIMNIICYASLAIWDIPTRWKWACFIVMGSGSGISGMCFAWANELCSDDNEERAIVIAIMNEGAFVFQAWLPLLVWKQVDQPRYQKGVILSTNSRYYNANLYLKRLYYLHLLLSSSNHHSFCD
jgi:MFS transporter, ACS family, pantothenate transporter